MNTGQSGIFFGNYTSCLLHFLQRLRWGCNRAWHFGQRRCFNPLARSVRGRVRMMCSLGHAVHANQVGVSNGPERHAQRALPRSILNLSGATKQGVMDLKCDSAILAFAWLTAYTDAVRP